MRLGAACLAPTATEDAGREEFSAGNHRKLIITRAGLAVWLRTAESLVSAAW
jgi:hypothetical protein